MHSIWTCVHRLAVALFFLSLDLVCLETTYNSKCGKCTVGFFHPSDQQVSVTLLSIAFSYFIVVIV